FEGLNWIQKSLKPGHRYMVYGKTGFYQGYPQIVHPEMELFGEEKTAQKDYLEPIYPSTEKLKAKGLGGKPIGKLTQLLFSLLHEKELPENLPQKIVGNLKLLSRYEAYKQIHFPESLAKYEEASLRIKFEELFISQLRLGLLKMKRHRFSKGIVFEKVGEL